MARIGPSTVLSIALGLTIVLTACTSTTASKPLYRDSARANTLPNVDVDPDDILDLRDDDRYRR